MGRRLFDETKISKQELLTRLNEIESVLPSKELLNDLNDNSVETNVVLNELQDAISLFPTRDEIDKLVKADDRADILEKIENMLTAFDDKNLRRIVALKREIEKLPIESLPSNVLVPSKFNLLRVAEKEQYLKSMRD